MYRIRKYYSTSATLYLQYAILFIQFSGFLSLLSNYDDRKAFIGSQTKIRNNFHDDFFLLGS